MIDLAEGRPDDTRAIVDFGAAGEVGPRYLAQARPGCEPCTWFRGGSGARRRPEPTSLPPRFVRLN